MTEPTRYPVILKALSGPQAEQLEDLLVLSMDLKLAVRAMALHFDRFNIGATFIDPDDDGHIISMSLFRDAIILFTGCFSTSDKTKLRPEAVYGHLTDWEKLFRYFHDMRDAFVAHNFGAARQHYACAALVMNGDKLEAGGIEHVAVRAVGLQTGDRQKILGLMTVAQNHVAALIKKCSEDLHASVKAMNQEELKDLPELNFAGATQDEVRLTRSKLRGKVGRPVQRIPVDLWAQKQPPSNDPPDG